MIVALHGFRRELALIVLRAVAQSTEPLSENPKALLFSH
jgi:hypothetical protein